MLDRDKLVHWFIQNEPVKYKEMFDSNHAVELNSPNIFHAEGTVWTHTMMVMTWVEAKYKSELDYFDYICLLTTALLHDTGKPNTQEEMPANNDKPLRNSFKGHEGVSTFFAVGVLKKLEKDFPDIYTSEMIGTIIKLISTHGVHIDEGTDLYQLKKYFRDCDKSGAVRLVEQGKFEQYEPRKYLKKTQKDENKNVIYLCGLPNSGKSRLREYLLNSKPDMFVVSRDDLLEEYYKQKTGTVSDYNTMYRFIHEDKEINKDFDNCFRELLNLANKSENVIVDMTLLSLSSRRKMMNNFPKHKHNIIVIMTDNNELFRRNNKRFEETQKYISPKVIENMMTFFVFPVLEEGFENIEFLLN